MSGSLHCSAPEAPCQNIRAQSVWLYGVLRASPKTCRRNAPGYAGTPQKIVVSLLRIGLTLVFLLNYREGIHYSTSCLTPPRLSSSSVHPFSRNVVSLERTQVLSRPSLLLGTAQIFCPVIIVISLGLSADALSRLLSV